MRDRRGVTRLGVVVTFALLTVAGGYVWATLARAGEKANRTRCHNALRQIGLAAIQQADDRRWFPHARARDELDGGVETADTPRALRQVVLAGYHDNPDGFVCPASSDQATPSASWWTNEDETPPVLAETRALSYGWTRRALNANVRSTVPLAADRAVRHDDFLQDGVTSDDPLQGNHVGGLAVVQADGSVGWWSTASDGPLATLAAADDPRHGGLAIVDPMRPRTPVASGWWTHLGADALALVPLGLAGAVFLLARPPAPPRPPRRPLPSRRALRRPGSGRVAQLEVADAVQAEQRCPYCHDALATTPDVPVALTSCSGCKAVFHAECVPEDGACTTLGCEARPT